MKKLITLGIIMLLSMYSFAQHRPTAVDDYASTVRGAVSVDVLANDFDADGDNIAVFGILRKPLHGTVERISDSLITYRAYPDFVGGADTLFYLIRDFGVPSSLDTGRLVYVVDNSHWYDSVSVNNIKTGINADGYMFAKLIQTYDWDVKNYKPLFEVPKNHGAQTIFSGSFWIAGLDGNDSLHVASQTYFANGRDYWPGPVSNVYDSAYDARYQRVWKVTRADIEYHLAHCWSPGYVPAAAIAEWPGNGNDSVGQFPFLAPFYDWGGDGTYQPENGDFPAIIGDEAVFFVFNDDRGVHTESGGEKLGVEIKGLLYAFDCPEDSALWNTVFMNLSITNRSPLPYHDAYLGTFVDYDLGSGWDDYTGCDVQRGSFYCYNGKNTDGSGSYGSYGLYPPAQSVTFLSGPLMPPDGLDNPAGNCDEGINGTNFGNSVIDDEGLGLGSFTSIVNSGSAVPITDPVDPQEFYNFLRGHWKDGTAMHYWGGGYPTNGGTGPICSYMYPATSDSCFWGTHGVDPGIVQPWTEAQAGNVPYDRRGLGVYGPFDLNHAQTYNATLAFVFARNFTDTNAVAAIPVLQQRIDSIRSYFKKDMTPCGSGFSGIRPQKKNTSSLKVYPNPTQETLSVEYPVGKNCSYEIFSVTGVLMNSASLNASGKQDVDVRNLDSGLYFIRVCTDGKYWNTRFVKQ